MDEELKKRIDEAVARFRAGESDVEEIEGPAGVMRLVRDPSLPQGFRMEVESDGEVVPISIRAFPASATEPDDYPTGLPFVENCLAMYEPERNRILWMNPPRPEEAFRRLIAASVDGGWEEVDLPPVRAAWEGRYQAEFRMAERERTLILQLKNDTAVLELIERHAAVETSE